MNKKVLIISIFAIAIGMWNILPVALKYLYPPKYAPNGYHVDFDGKSNGVTRAITMKRDSDKFTIGITQSAEDIGVCNGEIRKILNKDICWGLKLKGTNDLIITWTNNGYSYIVKTNDSLSIDDVAAMISNL